jgi:RNAse (barnase) inhibitor barstar
VKKLSDILDDVKASGVYVLESGASPKDVEKFAHENGFAFFLIRGSEIHTKADFLSSTAAALSFPDYFGNNWDAFEDCLTDMTGHEAYGYVLLFDDFGPFAEQSPDEFCTALEIFKDSAVFWADRQKAFVVLLRGLSREKPKVPVIGF